MKLNYCNAVLILEKDKIFVNDEKMTVCYGYIYRSIDLKSIKSVERIVFVIDKDRNTAHLFPEVVVALKIESHNLTKQDFDTYEIKSDQNFKDPIFLLKLLTELIGCVDDKIVIAPFHDRSVIGLEYVQRPVDSVWSRVSSLFKIKVA